MDAALGFPTVLFSFLLVVVVGYWLLVLFGGVDAEDADSDGAGAGFLGALGFGGVPAAVVLSLLIVLTWFASLAGTVLLGGAGRSALALGLLAAALAAGWLVTRILVLVLRRVLPDGPPPPSRADFVGATCVIRTGRVDARFGQAEVTAPDGSSALVQVRQAGTDPLRAGSLAMIYDFDAVGEFFWVVPVDAALRPDPRHPEAHQPGPRQPEPRQPGTRHPDPRQP